jgi:hypothetical protein
MLITLLIKEFPSCQPERDSPAALSLPDLISNLPTYFLHGDIGQIYKNFNEQMYSQFVINFEKIAPSDKTENTLYFIKRYKTLAP